MILDAFSLQGKVAVVSGCDTGLGQGMALGLAEAGCDIVGINIVEPVETIERVTALGRRFLSLTADLRQIDGIPSCWSGRWRSLAILIFWSTMPASSAARTRWRSAKGLGRRHEPQYQERIFHVPGGGEALYRPGQRREDH